MSIKAHQGPVPHDRADLTHARQLQAEYFDENRVLTPEQSLLAAKLAIGLADVNAVSVPEEALEVIASMLDPDFPGEPLSFHLHRFTHRAWMRDGRLPALDCRSWLLHEGRFVLDGVIFAPGKELSRGQYESLKDELGSPAASEFWAVNFGTLEGALDRMPDAIGIYNRLLGVALDRQATGRLTGEYEPLVASFENLSRKSPYSLVFKLGQQSQNVPSRIGFDEPGPGIYLSELFFGRIDDEFHLAGIVRALARHPALRVALAGALSTRGLRLLDPLSPSARCSILATGPEILSAGLASPAFTEAPWLNGATELLPLVDGMGVDEHGVLARVRAHLWIDPEHSHSHLDELLGDIEAIDAVAAEVLQLAVGRSVLEWVERHPDLLCSNAWQHSPRLRAAAWLAPRRIQDQLAQNPHTVRALVAAVPAARHELVPLARHLLGSWSERPDSLGRMFEGDSVGRFAAIALADPSELSAATIAFTEMRLEGSPECEAGLAKIMFVSGRLLKALGTPLDRMEDAELDDDLHSLFVRSAPFGTHEETAFDFAKTLARAEAHEWTVRLATEQGSAWMASELAPTAERPSVLAVIRAALSAVPEADADALVAALLCVEAPTPGAARYRAVAQAAELRALARAATSAGAGGLDLRALADSDAEELADQLLDRLRGDWGSAERLAPLIIAAARLRQRTRLRSDLAEAGVDVRVCGDSMLARDEIKHLVTSRAPGLDAAAIERIVDRCGDELIPQAVRDALTALVQGDERWAGGNGGPATLLSAVTNGPWAASPPQLARAVLSVLQQQTRDGSERILWMRGLIYALGKLREPLGGKVPSALHAIARNKQLPEVLAAVAMEQEPLFDKKNMAMQRKYTPDQRVMQAMRSLANSGARADGPGTVEVVRR